MIELVNHYATVLAVVKVLILSYKFVKCESVVKGGRVVPSLWLHNYFVPAGNGIGVGHDFRSVQMIKSLDHF